MKNTKRKSRGLVAKVDIRWMIRRDMPEVLAIDEGAISPNWLESDFLACLRQRNCIGMVAVAKDRIRGFMVYELYKTKLSILRFAVAPQWHGLGIGSAMITKLRHKLSQQRRSFITCGVPERNLDMQLFLREMKFRTAQVIRDDDGDTYVLRYRHHPENDV